MIPFKKAHYNGLEAKYAADALSGADYITRAQEALSYIYPNILLTSSGSAALELAIFALELPQGSEVIMPSFTYPSAANAVLRAGLIPVFADIDEATICLNIEAVQRKITQRTRCVIPTHYGGRSADMDALREVCSGIFIIEDAALSFGAKYNGKPLGTLGDMGTVSFHYTKNISAEQGGLLTIAANHEELFHKAREIYENGTNRADFIDGKTEFYSWQRPGMNAAMPNICSAVLCAQLEKADEILKAQQAVCWYYDEMLSPLADKYGFSLPKLPAYNTDNFHVYYLLFPDNETRERVRIHLESKGIGAYFHYVPLHMSAMGRKLGYKPEDLPIAKSVSERLLRLPLYAGLTCEQCVHVAEAIEEALCRK